MAPFRRPKRKIDNCSYVQQLFKNFLDNNRAKKVPEVFPHAVSRPVQRFPIENGGTVSDNLFRQGVKRNLMKAQTIPDPTNPVKQFFANPGANVQPVGNKHLANQPVHARFKRHEGSDQFVKSEISPSAPPRGLAQWLSMRKKTADEQRLSNHQRENKKKACEYMELPSNFFSGRESLKLPFEAPKNADKTMMSVGSTTFIPPATSTPFEGEPVVNSPILSDPFVELPRQESKTDSSMKTPEDDRMEDLRMVGTTLEQFCASFDAKDFSPVEQNYRALRQLWHEQCAKQPTVSETTTVESLSQTVKDRSSWKDHSLISNQIYHARLQQSAVVAPSEPSIFDATTTHYNVTATTDAQPGLATNSSSFLRVCLPNSRKRKIVDTLLTASPPSPPSILIEAFNENFSLEDDDLEEVPDDTLQLDFDFTQPSKRTFDEFLTFDDTRPEESFCFFPPTPDKTLCSSNDDASFFIAEKPRRDTKKGNETTFFDLIP
ncbi:uncharacterized protein LOC109423490 [Aedes albopictus]|uniref:Uncharacterized protein n=1 Tax=Aedes albopictus TaxID=7160 RepID=A0ABM1XWZ5_AEDAL